MLRNNLVIQFLSWIRTLVFWKIFVTIRGQARMKHCSGWTTTTKPKSSKSKTDIIITNVQNICTYNCFADICTHICWTLFDETLTHLIWLSMLLWLGTPSGSGKKVSHFYSLFTEISGSRKRIASTSLYLNITWVFRKVRCPHMRIIKKSQLQRWKKRKK